MQLPAIFTLLSPHVPPSTLTCLYLGFWAKISSLSANNVGRSSYFFWRLQATACRRLPSHIVATLVGLTRRYYITVLLCTNQAALILNSNLQVEFKRKPPKKVPYNTNLGVTRYAPLFFPCVPPMAFATFCNGTLLWPHSKQLFTLVVPCSVWDAIFVVNISHTVESGGMG